MNLEVPCGPWGALGHEGEEDEDILQALMDLDGDSRFAVQWAMPTRRRVHEYKGMRAGRMR